MKPTEILDAIIHLEREICDISEKMAPLRERLEVLTFTRSDVRALLNNRAPWEKIAERLSDFDAGIVPDPIEETAPGAAPGKWATWDRVRDRGDATEYFISDAPPSAGYEFRLNRVDGHGYTDLHKHGLDARFTLVDRAPYGRRADGTPKARPGRKAKEAAPIMKMACGAEFHAGNLPTGETEQAKAPVDEAKNAADLRIIKDVLTTNGPCPPSVLLHRSGLDADTIGAHVRAAAVIESYDGEYALEGGKPMPSIMIRLISQRPS